MQIFIRETVHQVKEAYPLLNTIVKRYPTFFMPNRAPVSVDYRVAKTAAQIFLWIASGLFAVNAFLKFPAVFVSGIGIGVGCGVLIYLVQTIIRRKLQYEGSWSMLYIQGTAIMKTKWRWVEASTLCGAALAALVISKRFMGKFPSWPIRQSGIGMGFSLGYFGCDLSMTLFRRIFPKVSHAPQRA